MDQRKTVTETQSHSRSQELLDRLQELLHGALDELGTHQGWPKMRRVLEALPISTEAFGVAVNRLDNAEQYATTGELGAAEFELRQLLRSFC